jgi:hypothetical protein
LPFLRGEIFRLVPDLHEDLLEQIVGFRLVMDNPEDERFDDAVIAIVELPKGPSGSSRWIAVISSRSVGAPGSSSGAAAGMRPVGAPFFAGGTPSLSVGSITRRTADLRCVAEWRNVRRNA